MNFLNYIMLPFAMYKVPMCITDVAMRCPHCGSLTNIHGLQTVTLHSVGLEIHGTLFHNALCWSQVRAVLILTFSTAKLQKNVRRTIPLPASIQYNEFSADLGATVPAGGRRDQCVSSVLWCIALQWIIDICDEFELINLSHAYIEVHKNVKVTLVQALRLCTGRTAHRGSRGIALLFLDHGTRRGWGVSVTPRQLFTPGKEPVPVVQEVGWAPGPVWTGAENLAPSGLDPRTVQPVASRYTGWATRPTLRFMMDVKYLFGS